MAFVLPYTFLPNTKIKSSEVNANFTAVSNTLNSLRDDNIAPDANISASKVPDLAKLQIDYWMSY